MVQKILKDAMAPYIEMPADVDEDDDEIVDEDVVVDVALDTLSSLTTKCEAVANELFKWMFDSLVSQSLTLPCCRQSSQMMFWTAYMKPGIADAFCDTLSDRVENEKAAEETLSVMARLWNVDQEEFMDRIHSKVY
jgi:hypothetical protein